MNHWQNKSLKDIDGEIWKPVPGYIGRYEVSNFGRVKKLFTRDRNRKTVYTERIITQHLRRGYLSTTVFNDLGISYHTKTHRLVAMAFIPNPDCKPVINHKDFNRINNVPENLEWVTSQENMDHMKLAGRSLFGMKNPSAILNEEDVLSIKLHRNIIKVKDIALKFGVSIPTVEAILYGRTWKHLRSSSK